jgi:hypothetical protein
MTRTATPLTTPPAMAPALVVEGAGFGFKATVGVGLGVGVGIVVGV